MTNEATVLIVEAAPLPDEFVAHLEAAGLFVEVVAYADLPSAYTVVAPDLVVHVGAAHAEATVRFLKGERTLPTRLVLVGSRAELTELRSLDRSVVQSVLALDIPEKLIVERIVSLGLKAVAVGPSVAEEMSGMPKGGPAAGFSSSAEEKIRVWVQSSRPPVISEKDEADEELDAPEELGYEFSPYVGVTPPGDESEPPLSLGDESEPPLSLSDESEPPPSLSDESEPPLSLSDESEPPLSLSDVKEEAAGDREVVVEASPAESPWVTAEVRGSSEPILADLEEDDRDTVVIERDLAAIFDAQHEKTPAFPSLIPDESKLVAGERSQVARRQVGEPSAVGSVRSFGADSGTLPTSREIAAAPTRSVPIIWGAALLVPIGALTWWLFRPEPTLPRTAEVAATVAPVLKDRANREHEPAGAQVENANAPKSGESLLPSPPSGEPRASLEPSDAARDAVNGLWRVREDGSVPSCETLVPNQAHLRLGDSDQGSRLWKQARGYLLLGNMKAAHVALCEASLVVPSGLVTEALIEHLLTLGAPARAEPLALRALKERPERPKTLELAGDVECQLGHPERALELWLKALGQKDPSPAALKQIARQLVAQAVQVWKGGHVALAERLYRRSAILDPNQTAAWLGLADIAEQAGLVEQAGRFRAQKALSGAKE